MKLRTIVAATLLTGAICISPVAADEDTALVTHKSLKLEAALELANAALANCRSQGFQVAVSVVDRGGNLQVTLRDRFAGPHTPDTSYRKAWTSVSFRSDTLELSKLTETGEAWAIRMVTNALPLGGGVQIREGAGNMIGAVGVSGAPSGSADEVCAKAGIAAIEDKIAF